MIEVLEFIFQDIWHWFGFLLYLVVIFDGLGGMVRMVSRRVK